MTEYWVSQGNKWCDFCKIFISNNPATVRNHELGQRHKDNVAKRLSDMRKDKAAKDKQEKEAARALEQIEAKARRSYQKDMASFQDARQPHAPAGLDDEDGGPAWEYNSSAGYYHDACTGIYYDPNSGFYYSNILGNWVTREEAFASVHSGGSKQNELLKKPSASLTGDATEKKGGVKFQSGAAPGPIVSEPLNPMRSVKGAASSVAVGKRKRAVEKPKATSAEEAAALKAREAARKRVEEREKNLLGLYGH